jgi:hypothetical protein
MTEGLDDLPVEETRVSMTYGGGAKVRYKRLSWGRRSLLTALCGRMGFAWDDCNAWVGPSARVAELVLSMREHQFFPLLEASVVHEMNKLVELEKNRTAWVPEKLERMQAASGQKFRPYQVKDASWMAAVGSGVLALEQRLGKSCLALTQVHDSAVIICPLAAVDLTWGYHVRRWTPWLRFTALEKFRWPEQGEVVCLNYARLCDEPGEAPVGCVIVIDEIHQIRNPATRQTRRVRAVIASAMRHDGHAWGLTGTPMPNGRPKELWELAETLRMGKRLFGSLRAFTREMTENWEDGGAKGLLSSFIVRRLRSQVAADIPPQTWRDWDIPFASVEGWARQALDRMWTRAKELGLDQGDPAELVRALHRNPEFKEISRVRAALAAAKIPAAITWAEEMEESGERAVVVSAHVEPVEVLGTRPGWGMIHGGVSGARRKEIVDAFHAGTIRWIAYTVGAGGTALDLCPADNLLSVDRDWVPDNNSQAVDRIITVDMALARPKFMVRMLFDHPLELRVEEVLCSKLGFITSTIDTLGEGGESVGDRALSALGALAVAPPKDVDLDAISAVLPSLTPAAPLAFPW